MAQVQETTLISTPITADVVTYTADKPKRKRKEWVYKSDYDRLDRKYKIVKRITLILLVALVIALRF